MRFFIGKYKKNELPTKNRNHLWLKEKYIYSGNVQSEVVLDDLFVE